MLHIEKALLDKGFSKDQIEQIKAQVHSEFIDDEMMYELHLVRLVYALQKGYCSIQHVLTPSKKQGIR